MRAARLRDADSHGVRRRGEGSFGVLRALLPYLWPPGRPDLRARVVIALLFLIAAKAATVMVPILLGRAVDALSPESRPGGAELALVVPVGLILAYGIARVTSLAFAELRDALFARVAQSSIRRIALGVFRHLHRLSLRFHLERQTGGLNRALERGTKGIEFLLFAILFSILPTLVELLLVAGVLWNNFGWLYPAVTMATVAIYVTFTFLVTEWRIKFRRQMNESDQSANTKAIDSLLNYETVKYFGAEAREGRRYDAAMAGYEEAAVRTSLSLAFLNFGQAFLITAGLVIVMVMAAVGVQRGALTVGDFVMVNSYMIQITMPLNFLGTVYREIRQALIDMADMFNLLEQPAEVQDKPDAQPLRVTGGEIVLDRVEFAYDADRPILHGVSLRVGPGETVAIVGSSGSGKSTIGRLLFRFYDVTGGAFRIDGQDLRDVTQASLHDAIGVVPQDTVLFNDTIRYNIGYGREGATDAEIEAAARAAAIHDFIVSDAP